MREEGVMRMGNNNNNKKRKKNRHLINVGDNIGGGNQIIGLLIFGGALAVAGFIAVINKNKTKGTSLTKPKPQQPSLDNGCKSTTEEDHEIKTTEGLCVLLQLSTTPTNNGDASRNGTTDMKSINHTCILEEKIDLVLETNNTSEVVQEIVLSDDSHPENEISSHDSEIEEEFIQGSQTQDVELEPQDQESLQLQSIETEKQDDGVVSEITKEEEEEGEGSSKEIMNSNIEKPVVWSAQEDFNSNGDEGKINIQNEEYEAVKTDTDAANEDMTTTPEITSNGKGNFFVVANDQPSTAPYSFQMTMLLPGLLLLPILLFLIYYTENIFVL